MKYIKQTVLSTLIASSFLASSTMAANVTGNFQATSTLNGSCTISAVTLNFGAIDQINGNQVSSTMTTKCSKGVSYSVLPNQGLNGGPNFRRLNGALPGNTDTIYYGIYKDAGLSFPFNNNTSPISLSGTGADIVTTLYGYLFNNQYATPDSYSDTIVLTLSY